MDFKLCMMIPMLVTSDLESAATLYSLPESPYVRLKYDFLIFGILILITTRYNVISEASLNSSPKNVSLSLFITVSSIYAVLQQICLQYCLHLCINTSISELRFYGWCHPC